MKTNSAQLISELLEMCRQNQHAAEQLKSKPEKALNWREHNESWSILECLEHLNRYGDFYIPAIRTALSESNYKPATVFKSGLLGNYFANSMLPKEKLNKMKTFTDKNPLNSQLDKSVLVEFINQQNQLMALLEASRNSDLNRVKVGITLSRWIKLKLGDTFRFVIYHNLRHMKQIERIEKAMQN